MVKCLEYIELSLEYQLLSIKKLMDRSLNLKVDLQMRFLGVELRLTTAED